MSVDDSMRRTIAEQHDEIGVLKAENAKLREQCRRLFDKVLELGTEIAKLHELVDCFVLAEAPSRREILTSNAIGLWAERNGIEVDG